MPCLLRGLGTCPATGPASEMRERCARESPLQSRCGRFRRRESTNALDSHHLAATWVWPLLCPNHREDGVLMAIDDKPHRARRRAPSAVFRPVSEDV